MLAPSCHGAIISNWGGAVVSGATVVAGIGGAGSGNVGLSSVRPSVEQAVNVAVTAPTAINNRTIASELGWPIVGAYLPA